MERQYKRTLDTSMSRHRKDIQNKLKTIRTKNPKEFWKILNKEFVSDLRQFPPPIKLTTTI